ncbi:hypothetical protein IFM89_015386 [Coptis chinensis]|uniref:RNase H type-1 domain-containing protein n=1 Tax=Coptis chinensis TaxID=261450 RepID=A0A835M4Z5_9MAGN|nr:hypothetical protein IFM89_015386 [Coptis chinensis]
MTKANVDGYSRGNPGQAGVGAVFRDYMGQFKLVMSRNIGTQQTNFMAEVLAIIECIELAVQRGWYVLWVESDSTATVHAFGHNRLPWFITPMWNKCKYEMQRIYITSTWREVNMAADCAARQGASATETIAEIEEGRPHWLRRWELPDTTYYRFTD